MSDTTMLPCPFCGGNATVQKDYGTFFALCLGPNCDAAFGEGYDSDGDARHEFSDAEAAIAAWNTRPAPALTPKQQAAEVMESALEAFVKAAESWHIFHNHTIIQCDSLCACIAPGRAALAKAGQQ